MPEFRYYCLNEQDRIVHGRHLLARDLRGAIEAAHGDCHAHVATPSRYRVEVWQGRTWLYVSDPCAKE